MSNDIDELLRIPTNAPADDPRLDALVQAASSATGVGETAVREKPRTGDDVASMAAEIRRAADAPELTAATPSQTTAGATKNTQQESSVAETILETAEMITGVGAIMTGLTKLFGSSKPEPPPAIEKFVMPSSVSVEAGLNTEGGFGGIRYSQGGQPAMTESKQSEARATSQAAGPTIQVNIQAMDSQSFLDRQDDIARAVREAMLHSNSLNDVVMEL